MGREAVVKGGDMLGDFDEPFSHQMEGLHGMNEAVIACVFLKGDRYYMYLQSSPVELGPWHCAEKETKFG